MSEESEWWWTKGRQYITLGIGAFFVIVWGIRYLVETLL
ncbi:hypothetical protein NSDW_17340 [Novosphingobium olei]|nr:hypothetical protein NSDW_17340 [Novosphingobium olei]